MLGAAAGAAVDDAFLAKLPFQQPVCLFVSVRDVQAKIKDYIPLWL